MKVFSEIEKLWISKTIESKGYCWFNNSFVADILIMNGEYYNKHLIGIYTERTWEDECPAIYFDFSDGKPVTITVEEENGQQTVFELTKEENDAYQARNAVDNDAFVWVKQPHIFGRAYELMNAEFDFDEFKKTANKPFKSLEEVLKHIESWMDREGSMLIELIRAIRPEEEPENDDI